MRVLCRSAAAEADATAAKKSVDSLDTLGLLDVAEGLVKQSTGSGIGAGTDAVAGFFGKSTEGANAIASLKTIAGQLISKMPRLEGPQSDKAVQLSKDMAGTRRRVVWGKCVYVSGDIGERRTYKKNIP